MDNLLSWFENNDKLAGWAQFFGAMLALVVTYFTAFAPVWRRKRQLKGAAERLLSHGHEAIESYYRTSEHFRPSSMTLRQAAATFKAIVDALDRFPIYELDDQGNRSIARYLVATGAMLNSIRLLLEDFATDLEAREATVEDVAIVRQFVKQQLELLRAMLSDAELKRPDPPNHQTPSAFGE